jgi:hypothetical protein
MRAYKNDTASPRYKNLYGVWRAIKRRCTNPSAKDFLRYGGRGITVCKEWIDFDVFIADMFCGYKKGLQIDRINNLEGYSKANCRWVTAKENSCNRRSNQWLEYKGERKTVSQWAEKMGISFSMLWQRIHKNKWPLEKCLYTKNRQA